MEANKKSSAGLSRRDALRAAALGGVALAAGGRAAFGQARGGEITVGTLNDVLSFDGYQYGDRNYVIQRLFYDHLIDYDYQLNPKPAGLRAWKMAENHLSAQLVMQSGIMLHSGRPWRVTDLVQALERASNPKEALQLLGPMAVVQSFKPVGTTRSSSPSRRPSPIAC
jgi:ABC-type transport system substrate-binding protein